MIFSKQIEALNETNASETVQVWHYTELVGEVVKPIRIS